MIIELPEFPNYLVYSDGRVYSKVYSKFISTFLNTAGYPCVKLYKNGKQHNFLIHRLLAYLFKNLPSLYSTMEVDHVDTNRLNFNLSNLQVLTVEEHRRKTLTDNGMLSTKDICKCGNPKTRGSTICSICVLSSRPSITLEQIEFWVVNYSWTRAAKELGLSDNGLRKRYSKLTGLDPRGLKRLKTK